jgi:succinyl-diaminopimelate desuccinylase
MTAFDPVAFAQQLIRCPSVTPADAGALDLLESTLQGLGFATHRLPFGAPGEPTVDNLYARLGTSGRNLCFAGHTDVVPPGPREGWTVDPFAATVDQGWLIGRGAADMKGSIAAFVAALHQHHDVPHNGSISLLITGDEEGPARHGTKRVLEWLAERGETIDHCLVGEPTSAHVLGDMVKIGRRGSLNADITVLGAQGHVAYPDRADNPATRLVALLADLKGRVLDTGNDYFPASNLEVTTIDIGNQTENMIPAQAFARLNIRFNTLHSGAALQAWIAERLAHHAPAHQLAVRISGEAFLTEPGDWSALVAGAVEAELGKPPQLSTTGGTSDARFIRSVCPVVEFGLVGESMHKADEKASVADIEALARIYARVLAAYFPS